MDLVFLVIGSTDQLFQHNYVECTLAFEENSPKYPLNFYFNENGVSDIFYFNIMLVFWYILFRLILPICL